VDSALLLAVARETIGARAVAATGVSPSLSTEELAVAREIAGFLGAPLLELPTDELARPGYVANRGDRCFHCKSELYGLLSTHPRLHGHVVCDGTHADDADGDRPGMRAARELAVRSPLREAGLGKAAIRRWARDLGLPNWDRPARPCLASRIAVGTAVTPARLGVVAALESVLAEEGFRVYRARLTPSGIIVQLGRDELARLGERRWRTRFAARAAELGERRVLVDRNGYRSPGEPGVGEPGSAAMELVELLSDDPVPPAVSDRG